MTGLFARAAREPVCDGEMPPSTAHRRRGVAHHRIGRSSVGARADVARVLPHVAAPRVCWTVVARSPRCPLPASPPVFDRAIPIRVGRTRHGWTTGRSPQRTGLCSLCGAVATCTSTLPSGDTWATIRFWNGHVRTRGTRWSCPGVRHRGALAGGLPGTGTGTGDRSERLGTDLTAQFHTFSAYTREESQVERFNWETHLVSTGDGPWHWVGGAFFNSYDSRGTSVEYAPGLSAFSGVTPILDGRPVAEPVEYSSLDMQAVEERALFGEISHDLGDRWRVTGGGRWFGYGLASGSLTEFPYTPRYNSPFSEFASDDRGDLFKGSVSYRLDDQTNAYVTRSEGYRIGGGNNFRVCTDAEIALLTDADDRNDPPQSGCIYPDQAFIRPDTTTNYEAGLRRSWRDERVTLSATLFHVD